MNNWKIKRAEKGLRGEITVPPDKSISHRSVMFGAIAKGKYRITNFLRGDDCMSTLNAFRALGIDIRIEGDEVIVEGKGLRGLREPQGELYLGNSGTTMRVISGILAGQSFDVTLTGDDSLSGRPMGRIIEPLKLMGAGIESMRGGGQAPLIIKGAGPLRAIDYDLPVASAQVKSCVLSAGLYARGRTSVREPFQSRDHTERILEYLGADILRQGLFTAVTGEKEMTARDILVPGDISSAAFFMVAALIVKGSEIVLRNVGINPTRTGILHVLERMGGDIEIVDRYGDVEPAGDIRVRHSGLKGTVIDEGEIPLLIDEIPVLCVAASMARGETVINGIKELKVKETDRIMTVKAGLSAMGAELLEKDNDTLVISGGKERLDPASVNSFGDHRIAMSMAVASLVSGGESDIEGTACADVSYPGFLEDLNRLLGV
ncbi:MAG: 3-phosphoshikimate 1-carboxyvinyltransferase [Candidatus Omnitrophica bacterium]|nr:3-phosphoshikimate 1-carboxyvinyltransferase [Candidatus Omnitrophota bacterium]